MKVHDLFQETTIRITESSDTKNMSQAAIQKELDGFNGKSFKDLEKWERGRKAELQAALNAIDAKAAEAAKTAKSTAKSDAVLKKEMKAELYKTLYDKIMDSISNSFPDGDPIDGVIRWMERNNLDITDLDKVMREHEGKSYNRYLASMWDDYAVDQVYDVKTKIDTGKKAGKDIVDILKSIDRHNAFYYVDDKGKVTKEPNPWK